MLGRTLHPSRLTLNSIIDRHGDLEDDRSVGALVHELSLDSGTHTAVHSSEKLEADTVVALVSSAPSSASDLIEVLL